MLPEDPHIRHRVSRGSEECNDGVARVADEGGFLVGRLMAIAVEADI